MAEYHTQADGTMKLIPPDGVEDQEKAAELEARRERRLQPPHTDEASIALAQDANAHQAALAQARTAHEGDAAAAPARRTRKAAKAEE